MKECKCCQKPVNENSVFCPFCGYDPRTDTINPSFKQKAAPNVERERKKLKEERHESHGISQGVKILAFIGLAVVFFSIFYKHNFSLKGVKSEFKQVWNKVKIKYSKSIPIKVEEKKEPEKKTEEPETFNPPVSLTVQGLVWGGAVPQAIINNKVVNMGDVIEGAEVIEISKNGVILLYKNRRYTLSLSASN